LKRAWSPPAAPWSPSHEAAVGAEGGDGIRCQFCVVVSPRRMWKHGGHQCPNCGKFYDAFLEIDADDE
jgi:hypothetical protein